VLHLALCAIFIFLSSCPACSSLATPLFNTDPSHFVFLLLAQQIQRYLTEHPDPNNENVVGYNNKKVRL
jgi:hypothetical protein